MSFSTYDELVRAALLQHSNRLVMALSEADRESKDLKETIERWKSECRAKDLKIKSIGNTLCDYGSAVDSMRNDKKRLNEIIKFRERDINDLRQSLNACNGRLKNLEGSLKKKNAEIKKLKDKK